MIFFDATKSASSAHRSGLARVSARLLEELGAAAAPVAWPGWDRAAAKHDWFLTPEIFSAAERPGFREFLRGRPCTCAAIFHDAIPLRYPHTTWPQSVARHPDYMKLLAGFDRVWAVSGASRADLLGYWNWLGVESPPPVDVLALGADFDGAGRTPSVAPRSGAMAGDAGGRGRPPALVCVGILEPRKNQSFLLNVCAELWAEGLKFDLHLVGRVNPHFGRPIAHKIDALRKKWPGLHYHAAATDADVARLFAGARATVFPTMAEGCGLPLLESLWRGVPCVCSDLPSLRESAAPGGCLIVPPNDFTAWKSAVRRILADDLLHGRLAAEATTRPLPTWAGAAEMLRGHVATC